MKSTGVYKFKDLQTGGYSHHTNLDDMLEMLISEDEECEFRVDELTEEEKIREIEGFEYKVEKIE